MIAKAGLGLIGLSAVSVGGVALAKPGWLGMGVDPMPEYTFLSKVASVDTTYTGGKFGHKHKKYLVSNEEKNKNWWDWAYRRLQEGGVDAGAFKPKEKVDSGFKTGTPGANDKKALNQVCDDAYKADDGNVKSGSNDNDKFNSDHVWKYCSPLGQKPTTVKEIENKVEGTDEGKYKGNVLGKSKEDVLVSVEDKKNDKFWEIRDQEFRETGEGSLSHGDTDSYFYTHKGTKIIKELCADVYGKEQSSATPKIETTTVEKYCAFLPSD